MQQFVPCTGCGNQVPTPELPAGMPLPQVLLCEACGQEFRWETGIKNDGSDALETPVEDNAENIQPTLELELELEEPGELEAAEEIVGAEEVEEAGFTAAINSEQRPATDWSVLGPPIKPRRTQEVSAIRKILPPILGGLAAFPIATMIMWYGFGKDIGSTGPTVAQYVPWIVPEKLRNSPWQYSARGTREDSPSARRFPRSAPQPRASFPTLNRENQVDETSDLATKNTVPAIVTETNDSVGKPVVNPDDEKQPKDESPKSSDKPTVAKPPISETIAKLRTLQKEWNNTPKSDQAKMLGEYYSEVRQLSAQAAELKGRSASVWRKELESISREILSHSHIPRAIQLGAMGKLPSVPASRPDEFIATVITIGDDNEPKPSASWILQEKWSSGAEDMRIEVLPGAWRAGAATLPVTCLVLGKLEANEASDTDLSTVVLKVHSLLPK